MTVARRTVVAVGLLAAWHLAVAGKLPSDLTSPDHGVVCNREHGTCFDRFGPSIGLTEIFLGREAAERLTDVLRNEPRSSGPGIPFSPTAGVECRGATGPCLIGSEVHEALTRILYRPFPNAGDHSSEARALIGAEWQWLGTRYGNDTEAIPVEPARYRFRLEPNGSLQVQADCNNMRGRYRLEGRAITLEITHSGLAECEAGSLEGVFLRDLSAAAVYFIRDGKLYLDLKYDTGTMEFGR
jgi:heat shock protein HslJ